MTTGSAEGVVGALPKEGLDFPLGPGLARGRALGTLASMARKTQARRFRGSLVRGFWILASMPTSALGQTVCDHEIPVEVTLVAGDELGIGPGDVVCLAAGPRPFLRFSNIVGSEDAPVVVVNEGGVVELENADRGYGLTFDASRYFRLSGTGSAETYGIRVRATRTGPDYSASCVTVAGLSTDYELDHLEIADCGFAGMNLKTEPTCDGTANLGTFVQRNSRVHHNFIHDTKGEGIYFGSTGYGGREYQCDGVPTLLYPHTHEGVYVHDNLIQDTGWDGMQIGVSPRDCFVERNTIVRVGLAEEEFQMQGLQIGGESSCVVAANYLAHGKAAGIFVLDAGNTRIENNVVVDFVDGIYVNDRDNPELEGVRYAIAHNTIVEASRQGIAVFGSRSAGGGVVNNLLVGATLGVSGEVNATTEGNLVVASLDEAELLTRELDGLDPLRFAPSERSRAVDAGLPSAEFGVLRDFRGAERDGRPDVGALEFGATPGEGGAPSAPRPGEGMAGAGPGEEPARAEGCGCRESARSASTGGGTVALLAALLALGAARRRRAAFDRKS